MAGAGLVGDRGAARLNNALGTVSPDFVKTSLLQLQRAARSPYGTISETAINTALAPAADVL
jgi:hypothetical protein